MEMLKILIIDDDPMTCSLLETILQMDNYQTASATSVNDILALLDQEDPNILIMDFHLKSQETLEFVPVIRGSAAWQDLPILMTSAIDRREDCLEAGANEFILKPFDWQDLTKTVNKIRDNL
ncbi:MAG: response regulator [Chloroflexi bacterium]|nr:response regulator [Chloroflexota bacterium]